jgi:hypothetical protein
MPEVMESQNDTQPKCRPNPGLKLMDQVREVLRYSHYAHRTEQTYGHWIRRYLHDFGGKTPPNRLGTTDVDGCTPTAPLTARYRPPPSGRS